MLQQVIAESIIVELRQEGKDWGLLGYQQKFLHLK